jgi:hypothetical protein
MLGTLAASLAWPWALLLMGQRGQERTALACAHEIPDRFDRWLPGGAGMGCVCWMPVGFDLTRSASLTGYKKAQADAPPR